MYVPLLGQSGNQTLTRQSQSPSLAKQVLGSQSETVTNEHETTMDETPQTQAAAGAHPNNQSPEEQASTTNITSDHLSANQTADKAVTNITPDHLSTNETASQTSEPPVDQSSSN